MSGLLRLTLQPIIGVFFLPATFEGNTDTHSSDGPGNAGQEIDYDMLFSGCFGGLCQTRFQVHPMLCRHAVPLSTADGCTQRFPTLIGTTPFRLRSSRAQGTTEIWPRNCVLPHHDNHLETLLGGWLDCMRAYFSSWPPTRPGLQLS